MVKILTFFQAGVKIGVARRFVSDIPLWIEDRKQNKSIGNDEVISD
jgi:hypothetical protein